MSQCQPRGQRAKEKNGILCPQVSIWELCLHSARRSVVERRCDWAGRRALLHRTAQLPSPPPPQKSHLFRPRRPRQRPREETRHATKKKVSEMFDAPVHFLKVPSVQFTNVVVAFAVFPPSLPPSFPPFSIRASSDWMMQLPSLLSLPGLDGVCWPTIQPCMRT